MAERAVLACEREDGRYAVFRSRWGGTDRALGVVCAGISPGSLPVSWEPTRVESDFPSSVEGFDFLGIEACYRDRRGKTTPFVSLWFGLPLTPIRANPGTGALVEVRSVDDARQVREAFRRLKGRLADALVAGHCPATVAPVALRSALAALDGRERHLFSPPGRPGQGL